MKRTAKPQPNWLVLGPGKHFATCTRCGAHIEAPGGGMLPVTEMVAFMRKIVDDHAACTQSAGAEEAANAQPPTVAASASLRTRAQAWLESEDTGLSSIALVSHLLGLPVRDVAHGTSHPYDPADFGRCHRALQYMPELKERLAQAKDLSPTWAALIERWTELTSLYEEEGPSGMAPKLYAAINQCRRDIPVSAG